MGTNLLDFETLNRILLTEAHSLLPDWLPGGAFKGKYYVCADINGGAGRSFSVNTDTGQWGQFNAAEGGDRGGDMISLYATKHGLTNPQAYEELAEGRMLTDKAREAMIPKKKKDDLKLGAPPASAPVLEPPGSASAVYEYRDAGGALLHYIVRYDRPDGKVIVPYTWSRAKNDWVKKAYPTPRPIYGLDLLAASPDKPVMVVEGEKCADVARREAGDHYVVVTWSGGSSSWQYTDWTPLAGRKLFMWPDADEAGIAAMDGIVQESAAKEVRILDVVGMPDKWDLCDAMDQWRDWKKVLAWGKPRTQLIPLPEAEEPPKKSKKERDREKMSSYAIWSELKVDISNRGIPVRNLLNAARAIANAAELKDRIWYDEFYDRMYTTWDTEDREWTDADTLSVTRFVQNDLRLPYDDGLLEKAVRLVAHDNTRDAVKKWMEELEWDGKERIATVFEDAFGAEPDSVYTQAASENFFLCMAARIMKAPVKVDNMIILEGKQGAKKSTALEILGGPWYALATESINTKDFFLTLKGKLIMEIGEMDAFNKADTQRIKNIVSSKTDRYRVPYGRWSSDWPRRCVFVGTTNEDHYLRDHTGARRFWPILCGDINLDILRENRIQYFAEAKEKLKAGATWWEMPQETEDQQERRREADSWEEIIAGKLKSGLFDAADLTTSHILQSFLEIDPSKQEIKHSRRIGHVMKKLGYKTIVTSVGGESKRVFRKVED